MHGSGLYKCIITMIITLLMIHDAFAKGPLPNPVGAYKTEQPAGANPLVFAMNLNYQGQSSDHVNIISFRMCIFYQKINNLIDYSLFSSTLR